MRIFSQQLRLSATDLSNHLACHHLSVLDLSVARGSLKSPDWKSPDLEIIRQLGAQHEQAYLQYLAKLNFKVHDLREIGDEAQAVARTIELMKQGADIIAQGALAKGRWFGRPDVLRKALHQSELGEWSYHVYDCKLALETKGTTILQLSLYSELVAEVQGRFPEWMFVVTPTEQFQPEPYRVAEYAAYCRYIKLRFESLCDVPPDSVKTYPEPVPHCSICRWFAECDKKRRDDDHLSLVAGITRLQQKQLRAWETDTTRKLAALPIPLQWRPDFGVPEGYVRVREQARVQVAGIDQQKPVHELLAPDANRGLSRLPEPSSGDIFFDLEGDPFVSSGGREYLFGFVANDGKHLDYSGEWALNSVEEKQAFESFVDQAMARWKSDPKMHIYHFGSYEPSALKRLMGRYATREEEIDRMLRSGLLVDLHTVYKQSVRASVEEYSLKAAEVFHGFKRGTPLEESRRAMRYVEHALELGRVLAIPGPIRITIEGYNADDCHSTKSLRDWLEKKRTEQEAAGHKIPRPSIFEEAAPEKVAERQQRVIELVSALTNGLPIDPLARNEEQSGQWLMAQLLDWHRREEKSAWWEFFRLKDLGEEDLLEEKAAIAHLRYDRRIGVDGKSSLDRYIFDKQETEIRDGDTVVHQGDTIGKVFAIDVGNRTIDIKKSGKAADFHPPSIYKHEMVPTGELSESLFRIGDWISENGIISVGRYQAARDLLQRTAPRLGNGEAVSIRFNESIEVAARRIVASLNDSVLPVQGPPGAGKTYTGARMICELIRRGKKVGITSNSHKAIRLLVDEALKVCRAEGLAGTRCIQKVSDTPEEALPDGLQVVKDNGKVSAALVSGTAQMAAGTAWLWSREEFFESVDALFIDEAGQMSLANVVAVSQAAKSLVLLGDPQQLDQPLKGSHPEGAEKSALEHLLGEDKTISAHRGLFLQTTWRLHPKISEFTSELFYENRLRSSVGLENQQLEEHATFGGAGLWFVPVAHQGNQNTAHEEVEAVGEIARGLLSGKVKWTDHEGRSRKLVPEDILIVAPYNAQVSEISERLLGFRVGTVDKFQGQEAPVVIYSLTSSSPEDAPRGMEFLYSLNRLNVATSRARSTVIIVGSPRLFEPDCRSPRQMQLANALCRYREVATTIKMPKLG
jgi:predicted RecB family nuclease